MHFYHDFWGLRHVKQHYVLSEAMSSVFSTIINFGMLGLLQRLHRLQVQFTIQADANSGIVFPRLLKNQSKEGKNAMKKCCLSEVTNEKILSAVEKAEGDAKKAMEKLGMPG